MSPEPRQTKPAHARALDSRALALGTVALLALGGLTAPACADDAGGEPLAVRDASEGCGGSETLAHPVALGATLELAPTESGLTLTSIASDDPGVVAVVDATTVRAAGAGATEVLVRDDRGRSLRQPLTVASIERADVVLDALVPWNLTTTLAPGEQDVSALRDGPIALLPDARVRVHAALASASGEPLIGWDAVAWAFRGAPLFADRAGERTDDLDVRHGGIDGDVFVAAGDGAERRFVLTSGAAARLALHLPDRPADADAVTVAVGESTTLVLLAFDAGGHLLLGNGDGGFAATITAGDDVAGVEDPPWVDDDAGLPLDDLARAALREGRVVYLRGRAAGSATVRLSAAGLALDVPVTVVAP
ncbi:MAG: hypothetical protein KC635_15775 [Myxococcales bacterium]|nr:hypothetical protein [Myxococcales bacterium]